MRKVLFLLLVVFVLSLGSAYAKNMMGFGVVGDLPVFRMEFNEKFKADFGISQISQGDYSAMTLSARGSIKLAEAMGSTLHIPIVIMHQSFSNTGTPGADDYSQLVLRAGIGAETFIKKNLSVGFDVYVLSTVSPSDSDVDSTTELLSGAIMGHYYF